MQRIVIITGFESFNSNLYREAAQLATSRLPELEVLVFNDRSLASEPEVVEKALQNAQVFFASLIFDYDQVIWLQARVKDIPIRLIFESALELMSLTQLGKFTLGGKPKGMPKPIQFILSKFSSGREEDKLAGYLSFLKTGPKLLKFIPSQKVQDLRNWLIIYSYWNAGGSDNFAAMCWTIAEKYLGLSIGEIPSVEETPNLGLLHPDYSGYFTSPQAYLQWYEQTIAPVTTDRVAILLYRKHVITKQAYIAKLIREFEQAGLIPVPIFLNGVESHVAVRDWLTSDYEQQQRKGGNREIVSLSPEAVTVQAIVSTIGFPLVGGPAGSMEAGRQVEVAKKIDAIAQKIIDTGLDSDCKFKDGKPFNLETVRLFSKNVLNEYFGEVYEYLQILEQRLFSSGLHTLGSVPTPEEMYSYLEAYFGESGEWLEKVVTHQTINSESEKVKQAEAIRDLP